MCAAQSAFKFICRNRIYHRRVTFWSMLGQRGLMSLQTDFCNILLLPPRRPLHPFCGKFLREQAEGRCREGVQKVPHSLDT